MHLVGIPPMESAPIPASDVIEGNPVTSWASLYTTPDRQTMIGYFTCSPGKFRFKGEAEEFTHLLAGHVVIERENGDVIDARPGDTYVVPANEDLVIDVREAITDIYATWVNA